MTRTWLVAWLALAACVPSWCAGQEERAGGDERPLLGEGRTANVTVLWGNDGRYFNPTQDRDRHLTNAVEIDVGREGPVPGGLDRLVPLLGLEDPRTAAGVVVGQQIFTPGDIQSSALIVDDRPYAGWLYAGVYMQRRDAEVMDHVELDVGVVGEWSGAEAAQKFVHSVLPNQFRPNGWDNQLANELGVDFRYVRRWRTERVGVGVFEADAVPQAGFRVGNIAVNGHVAVTGRIGRGLPDDFGPDTFRYLSDQFRRWEGDWGWYVYGRLGGRGVAHDIFLDGNTFANSHSVDRQPFVGEAQVGLVGRYKWLEAGWSITWLMEEFEGQKGGGDALGEYVLRVRFDY